MGTAVANDVPACPECGGKMWDNRESKRNPKAPDFKCRDKGCEGVVWPPKNGQAAPRPAAAPSNVKQSVTLGAPIPGMDEPHQGGTVVVPAALVESYRACLIAARELVAAEVPGADAQTIQSAAATLLIQWTRGAR
jgi:hypothetical protein